MITFAICDDGPFMLDDISAHLADYMSNRGYEFRIHCFTSGKALLKSSRSFDMIFLDIQMEEPDGMETARQLRRQGYDGMLVFLTILRERVFDAFEVQAHDYLLKPVDTQRLERTLDRLLHALETKAEKNMVIQKGNACQVIPFSEILYCEVLGRKIYIHMRDGQVTDYYEKLANLEKQMDSRFFRCHRSYLVNLDFVRSCKGGFVHLIENAKVPVSRLRERDLAQALLLHMKGRCP